MSCPLNSIFLRVSCVEIHGLTVVIVVIVGQVWFLNACTAMVYCNSVRGCANEHWLIMQYMDIIVHSPALLDASPDDRIASILIHECECQQGITFQPQALSRLYADVGL